MTKHPLAALAIALLAFVVVVHGSIEAPPALQAGRPLRAELHDAVAKLALSADVTATIEQTLFAKICAIARPMIVQIANSMTIPGESSSHFSYNSFQLSGFAIGSLAVTFASPDKLMLSLDGLSFSVPHTGFKVKQKVLITHISCSGNFWASLTATNIHISLAVSTNTATGKLRFGNAVSSVDWGRLSVGHSFHNVLCKVANSVVQAFIGNVDKKIENTIKTSLPPKLAPALSDGLNAAFDKLSLDFVSSPIVTPSGISVTVNILPLAPTRLAALPSPLAAAFSTRALPPRDIALLVPVTAVNNLLLYEQQAGVLSNNVTIPADKLNTTSFRTLIPAAYALCPGCPFVVDVGFNRNAPTASMDNNSVALSVVDLSFGVNALNASSGAIIDLVDLTINCTAAVTRISVTGANATVVYFNLALSGFNIGLAQSQIGPIDTAALTQLTSSLLNVMIALFNYHFTGVPLPAELNNAVVEVSGGVFNIGMDMVL